MLIVNQIDKYIYIQFNKLIDDGDLEIRVNRQLLHREHFEGVDHLKFLIPPLPPHAKKIKINIFIGTRRVSKTIPVIIQ